MNNEPRVHTIEELREMVVAAARDRFQRGEAVVGGQCWSIDPAQNYVEASRLLVQDCEARRTFGPLALPIMFLQRHAVELTLKDLCRAAYQTLAALGTPRVPVNFDVDHHLRPWLDRLQSAVQEIGLEVPATADAVVAALEASGDSDGQSWRYGRVKEKRVPKPAFPEEKNLPIRELQRQVEAFSRDAFGDGPGGEGLYWNLDAIAQDVQIRELLKPAHR